MKFWVSILLSLVIGLSGCRDKEVAKSNHWIETKKELVAPEPYQLKETTKEEVKVKPAADAAVVTEDVVEVAPPTPAEEKKEIIVDTRPVVPPVIEAPKETATPLIANKLPVALTVAGLNLILDFETGGRSTYMKWPHPEYIGDEYSGLTWSIGYDAHQNSKVIILQDWDRLGKNVAIRLSESQPYYGKAVKEIYLKTKDIFISWEDSIEVFQSVDIVRVDRQCKRAFPGFDKLRPGAKDAIRSLVFNRGAALNGDARLEMREIARLIEQDEVNYKAIANQFIKMKRVWVGKSIYNGMARRRDAEAKLVLAE